MSEPAPAAPDSAVVPTQAVPPAAAGDRTAAPAAPAGSGPAILALQRIGLDWWAVILGAVAVLVAALGVLPDVPWDDVNLPTFHW